METERKREICRSYFIPKGPLKASFPTSTLQCLREPGLAQPALSAQACRSCTKKSLVTAAVPYKGVALLNVDSNETAVQILRR